MTLTFGADKSKAHVHNISGKKNPWLIYISDDKVEYDIEINNVIKFLETRCVPKTRDGIQELLRRKYKMKEYSALGICRQTHGVMYNDFLWIKFNDEQTRFEDVRIR